MDDYGFTGKVLYVSIIVNPIDKIFGFEINVTNGLLTACSPSYTYTSGALRCDLRTSHTQIYRHLIENPDLYVLANSTRLLLAGAFRTLFISRLLRQPQNHRLSSLCHLQRPQAVLPDPSVCAAVYSRARLVRQRNAKPFLFAFCVL